MATHLLDSMIKGNRAKYTEVESIFSFIVNGINGFLLAGETSIGKYPVEAFLFLKKSYRILCLSKFYYIYNNTMLNDIKNHF